MNTAANASTDKALTADHAKVYRDALIKAASDSSIPLVARQDLERALAFEPETVESSPAPDSKIDTLTRYCFNVETNPNQPPRYDMFLEFKDVCGLLEGLQVNSFDVEDNDGNGTRRRSFVELKDVRAAFGGHSRASRMVYEALQGMRDQLGSSGFYQSLKRVDGRDIWVYSEPAQQKIDAARVAAIAYNAEMQASEEIVELMRREPMSFPAPFAVMLPFSQSEGVES
jgi:hypothetical protein